MGSGGHSASNFTKCPTRAARSCRFRSRVLRVLRDRSRANAALVDALHASLFPLQGPIAGWVRGWGHAPKLYSTRSPSLRFLVRGAGGGMPLLFFHPYARLIFLFFCRALARAGIVKMWLQISAILRGI